MKFRLYPILAMLAVLLSANYIFAQSISGSVKDSKGPLIGATVIASSINGTKGAITDDQGNFLMTVDAGVNYEVTVSFIGYFTQTKEATVGDVLEFVMNEDALGFDEVVVTGVTNPATKIESSVSITTLKTGTIQLSAPRSTAEIFRTIPGIRSEASGGDGNTNIAVRGVPISAGGSKYLQLQEDGLPIFLYGDIAFATSDIFLRIDQTIARVEALRGGSASTLASNSPAGIINIISKTGETEGGSISQSFGLNYDASRTDFEYGSPIANDLNFHIGGFFRADEGPRTAGYTANKGGQIKANLTKYFKNGYARVYVKYLNDHAAAYMPMPVQVSGTNDNPTWESIDGYSATLGALQSPFLQSNFGFGANGERRSVDVADGMYANSNAIGTQFSFEFGSGWEVEGKARYSRNSGRFVAPFTAAVGTTSAMLATVDGAVGADLTGATLYTAHDGAAYTGELAQVVHVFDTELNNFDNIVSDTKLSKTFNEDLEFSIGYYSAQQNIDMAWLWNSYLMEVKGEDAALLNIVAADSSRFSESGQFAYGVPVWGNCCQRRYDNQYNIRAPYASISFNASEAFNFDVSARYDFVKVRGYGYNGKQARLDVNLDGVISPIEESVSVIDAATKNPVKYDYGYFSFSFGANYKLSNNTATFLRISQGYSGKADRLAPLPGTAVEDADGNAPFASKDQLTQAELGLKQKFTTGGIFLTAFYAGTVEEGGYEATTQKVIENDYNAYGLELEGFYEVECFNIRGAATYTKASIASGDNEGNTPRRQPALMYSLVPAYKIGNSSIGLSIIGQSKAFAQDNNQLIMPAYTYINAFVDFNITKGLSLFVNANNLFDTIGITESEEGSITEGQINYIRARSISGRSILATLRYQF